MTRRYRLTIAAAGAALIVAVGGIAVAEQGGQSADHRKNPTTTTVAAESTTTTTTTTTTVVTNAAPKSDESEGAETDSNGTTGLLHALCQGSERGQEMKRLHGQAFQQFRGVQCPGQEATTPEEGGDETGGDTETQGPPENSHAGGNGGGQGNANSNAGGGNPHKP